ncbi:hypothetical protein G9A89_015109 [Geosiphon pyriformis]|nr:hypothetical protein G9A89_015109 [Geosiphon pyriformis]
MPFSFKRSNSSNSSIDTSTPPESPSHTAAPVSVTASKAKKKEVTNEDGEVILVTDDEAENVTDANIPTYIIEPEIDPDIPPDSDEWGNSPTSKKRFRSKDNEPVLYQDKFIAVSSTYLYIFNYYIPDSRDKAVPLTNIQKIQTDQEARVSDLSKWGSGSGGFDLWWARDFGRWKNHDLCAIVTVNHGWVKRKGFTLESKEGLTILKKAWGKAKGLPHEDD